MTKHLTPKIWCSRFADPLSFYMLDETLARWENYIEIDKNVLPNRITQS